MTRGCSVPIWQKRGRRKCKTRRRAAGKRFAEKWHGRTHARQNVRETLGKIFESECIPVMRWRRPYPPSCLSGRHWGWCFRFRPPFSLTTLFFLWSPPVFGSPRFGESTSDSDPKWKPKEGRTILPAVLLRSNSLVVSSQPRILFCF